MPVNEYPMRRPLLASLVLGCAVVSGCGRGAPVTPPFTASNSLAEFEVVPADPLTIPVPLTLAPPTPGGTNRADPDPDTVAARASLGIPPVSEEEIAPVDETGLIAAKASAIR